MSDIRFNQWLHQSGTGGVSQSDGGHVGIGTTNPLIPVGAGNTHILNVGVVTCNNISAGSSITATTFYGSGANLTNLPAQATIANNADNRVITGGSGVNLNGESQFTYDGTKVSNIINVAATSAHGEFRNSHSTYGGGIRFGSNNTYGMLQITNYDNSANASIYNSTGGWHWDSNLQFHSTVSPWTNNNVTLGTSSKKWQHTYTGSINNVLHISSGNNVGVNVSSPTARLHVDTSHYLVTSSGRSTTGIHLDGTWGNAGEYGGGISFACGRDGSAAIAARQGSSDGHKIGIAFFTHDSSTGSANAVEKVRIHDGGATSFNNGIILGNGLNYNANNLLDDYEEGSFTLTAAPSSSGTLTLNSSYNTGVYTRVGNLVKIQAYLSISGNNNATGYVELSSLPFTVDSNQAQASGHVRAIQVVYLNGQYAYLPDGAGYYNAQLYCNEGNTWIRLYDLNDKGRRIDTIARHLSGGADLFLNFSYLAA